MTTAPKAGELFAGQYRVERVLGQGGMGVVLAAWDEQNARGVALKVLQVTDATSVQRFHREARSMKKLASDHVVKVIDSGTVDDTIPYLVMERLVGANLSEYLKANGGKLGAREVADIVIQACEALAHAHAAGIVHRDVKPSNLYVHVDKATGKSIVKVLDFGISKQLSREEWEKTLTETAEGGVLGSPPYMSPEHVRDPKNVDLRADIWALGVLLHKLATGVLPFDGDSVGEIFAKVLEAKPPGMAELPPRLRAVIERCLTRDRNQRYPSTMALAEALAPLASPEIAAIVSKIPLSAAANDEPSTMTVDHPPPIFTGPPIVPTSVTPPAAAIPMPTFGQPEPVRSRRALAVGLAVAGIAIGVVIGFAVRRPIPPASAATTPMSTEALPTTPTAPSAAPSAAPPASAEVSAAPSPSPATVTSAAPSASVTGKRIKPRGTPASSKGTAAVAPPPPVVTTPPERPELQDNPYNKK